MSSLHSPEVYGRLELTDYTRKAVGSLSVAVVGCGALGSEAARLLGLLGAGSVLLIDPDVIEATNFIHSPYLRSATAPGRRKAQVLAERLANDFPDTSWTALCCEIADVGFQRLQGCALLFSCTDSVLARVETCYAAYRLQLPMIDAGLMGRTFWSGRVAWLPGGPAACYLCQLGEGRRAELLSLSLAASHSCSANADGKQILPSTPTMASIIAGLQVDLGLRLTIAGTRADACAWELSLPLPETSWRSFAIPRAADCPWHEIDSTLDLVRLPMDVPLNESLMGENGISASQSSILELDWPICVKARCGACRHVWRPMLRVAILRRSAVCPACGRLRPRSVEALSRVAPGDPFARLTPRQLGLPSDHLFSVRAGQCSPRPAVSQQPSVEEFHHLG